MIRSSASLLVLISLTSMTWAEERMLDGSELKRILSDEILVGAAPDAGIEQIFQTSGVTLYKVKGAQSQGFWRVENDKYCSVWPPSEHWACYNVTTDGQVITFISSSGTRFPMRAKETAE